LPLIAVNTFLLIFCGCTIGIYYLGFAGGKEGKESLEKQLEVLRDEKAEWCGRNAALMLKV